MNETPPQFNPRQLTNGKWKARVQMPTTRLSDTGKRIYAQREKTFATKGAAEAWVRAQKQINVELGASGNLTQIELAEYRETKAMLDGADLREVAIFWIERHPKAQEITLSEALKEYEDKAYPDFQGTTIAGKKSILRMLNEALGSLAIQDITPELLEDLLDDLPFSETTFNNYLRGYKTFFKWCTKRKNRFIANSPAEALEYKREDAPAKEFLSVSDVKALFREAEKKDPGLIPCLALAFFAGIRAEEIKRLAPEDIHYDDKAINIRPEVAKRKRKGRPLPRYIEHLPEALWLWLKPFVDSNSVVQLDRHNLDRRRHRLCVSAGINYPRNAARHSFATYGVAFTSNPGKVCGWTGHRSQQTLEEFYKGLTPKATSKAFFALTPSRSKYELKDKTSAPVSKADWPSPKELADMVKKQPVTHIACALGVSDQAVRKHLKKLGLKTMPRGYWASQASTSSQS
ncbi:hypothetical protein [Ruficoccus sp. ZRK36]|uniref:tyrosine-type recombinase/integrase n=1 Tax=Ruficoccus sp. ZRK36 TaxID=2866311 RepID=UPI001C729E9C|nr:hypothetical protein [Ruficoccus sp. ZRK36]QYY36723.1 hypothetical protein K0V07_04425 [Ruficoccus sp. ZRK36]